MSPSRLDEVLPEYTVSKLHRLTVPASPDRVFRAVQSYEPGSSRVAAILMALRGYGSRVRRREGSSDLGSSLAAAGFVPLGGRPGREVVFGLAGRFWRLRGGLRSVTPEEFLAFSEEGWAKAAWNIQVSRWAEGGTLLETETRVLCFGERARRRFRRYWSTIEFFSGLIRMSMLRGIARQALSEGGDS